MSAVQELTALRMQARVIGVLESIASATPGLGFVIGGLIATGLSPRATFLVAGAGVVATAAIAAPLLGTRWAEVEKVTPDNAPEPKGAGRATMVELIAGGRSAPLEGENRSQPEPEVRR
jgi:MFS family permease